MSDNRLVKVAMPTKLVTEMDRVITNSAAYAGRTEFVADAVANLLADLKASDDSVEAEIPTPVQSSFVPTQERDDSVAQQLEAEAPQESRWSDITREEALSLATLKAPGDSVPTAALDLTQHRPKSEPTWGMHNRDWPTVWAASILGTMSTTGPVEYKRFADELVSFAWSVASVLRDDWDLSGFPSNGSKAARSEVRFIEFFVGSDLGTGPLFTFGLATPTSSNDVVLTDSGASLLKELSGMTRRKGLAMSANWRRAFLRHLAVFAPADVEMLREIVRHIANGDATRVELISAIEREHPDWPKGTSATNAAGYVARAREWGLLSPKQQNHQYVVEAEAVPDLEKVSTPELRSQK